MRVCALFMQSARIRGASGAGRAESIERGGIVIDEKIRKLQGRLIMKDSLPSGFLYAAATQADEMDVVVTAGLKPCLLAIEDMLSQDARLIHKVYGVIDRSEADVKSLLLQAPMKLFGVKMSADAHRLCENTAAFGSDTFATFAQKRLKLMSA